MTLSICLLKVNSKNSFKWNKHFRVKFRTIFKYYVICTNYREKETFLIVLGSESFLIFFRFLLEPLLNKNV